MVFNLPAGHGDVGIDVVTLYHNIGFPLWLLLSYAVCLIIGCAIVVFWPSKGSFASIARSVPSVNGRICRSLQPHFFPCLI